MLLPNETAPRLTMTGRSIPPPHLLKVWRFVRWLDQARWYAMGGLIPGPIFGTLKPDEKLLTHWLCYITDQQRPYEQVWEQGGPIFAEIVRAYTTSRSDPLNALKQFTMPAKRPSGVDLFTAKVQVAGGKSLSFTPRFGVQMFSIATTLDALERYNRSLTEYLAAHWGFCTQESQSDGDDPTHRIAFLLYLLSYWEITTGLTSVHRRRFRQAVERRTRRLLKILSRPETLQQTYDSWLSQSDRYHKRLWAALRDYVKPGSTYRAYLLEALEAIDRADIVTFFQSHEIEVLRGLEVPGDVWNLRFFSRVLGATVNPSSFRAWYEALRKDSRLPDDTYVEQFDVSFDYSAEMCANRSYGTCILRRESRIRELCLPLNGIAWEGKLCPVTAYLCGYEYPCTPKGCPVREEEPEDLCEGCILTISEQLSPAKKG